jgi:hypothetical protein
LFRCFYPIDILNISEHEQIPEGWNAPVPRDGPSIAAVLLAAYYGFESQCHLPNDKSGTSLTRHEENGRGCGRKGRGMVERGSKGRGWGAPPSSRFTRRGR